MLKDQYPYFLANQAFQANADLEVTDKFTGKVATRVALADAKAIDAGIAAAVAASEPMREFPPFKRQAVLEHCVMRFRERFDELAMALCIEAGKPIRDARGAVGLISSGPSMASFITSRMCIRASRAWVNAPPSTEAGMPSSLVSS